MEFLLLPFLISSVGSTTYMLKRNDDYKKAFKRLNYQLDGVMREYELIDGIYCGFRVYSKLSSD